MHVHVCLAFMHRHVVACMDFLMIECIHAWNEVLLMQWNCHFDFASEPYDFVELFAGQGHCSKAWTKPQGFHACIAT